MQTIFWETLTAMGSMCSACINRGGPTCTCIEMCRPFFVGDWVAVIIGECSHVQTMNLLQWIWRLGVPQLGIEPMWCHFYCYIFVLQMILKNYSFYWMAKLWHASLEILIFSHEKHVKHLLLMLFFLKVIWSLFVLKKKAGF